jgi:ATP-binding cassette, subfamily D (ALD), peroxisomal long-chain fatty acid import protein
MYEHAKALGITLITISLRSVLFIQPDRVFLPSLLFPSSPSLAKYHTQLLTLSGDGTGSWTLARIGTAEARMGIDREIGLLQSKLKEVERWERRVKELDVLLGPQGVRP